MERTLETLVEFAAVQRDSLNRLTQSIQTMNSHLGDKIDRLGEKIDLLAGGVGDLSGNVAATNRAIEGQLIVANKVRKHRPTHRPSPTTSNSRSLDEPELSERRDNDSDSHN